ncbi:MULTISPECIES: hypothetical protein [unclassified Paenibacillus]|uniref:hypothetical protein n=1 Tax=unclassified Paenibacillus TaxID=185978 RepID=UPI003630187F
MTNYSIFNQANAPLYTNMTNTYANPGVETLPEGNAAISSLLFTLTTGSVSVSSGQSLLLQAANPSHYRWYIPDCFGRRICHPSGTDFYGNSGDRGVDRLNKYHLVGILICLTTMFIT